jgi:hypothetical protein
LIIRTQVPATSLDFLPRRANVFEVLLNLRFIAVATVVTANVTPVIMLGTSLVMILSAITIPSPVMGLPFVVMIALLEMMMTLFILGVRRGGQTRND